MGRLDGKVCLATGAGNESGIGFATAVKFAAEGAKAVVLTCRPGPAKLAAAATLADKIHSKHPATDAIAIEAEAASEADMKKVFDEMVKRWGRVDVVFANAGWGGTNLDSTPLTEITEEDFMYTLRTNVLHPFFCLKHGIPAMQLLGGGKTSPGGSIVINGSTSGVPMLGARISADYVASKAAANSLAETASYQLSNTSHVRINTLAPGYIETGMTAADSEVPQFTSKTPGVGRTGRPEEMANVVAFLASDEASYVSGATWIADGGIDTALPMYMKQTPTLPERYRLI
ncbi:NAD(P)-binding protein [Gonapodya prolifera JEL478]|uniref:NAD(P)-binding protein n=1 Tax=Gonapodya prolifera (strain JEL478) TaxID=1344416 RepID=A0A139AC05_GONPJ|nr:NAD(P)-binding protein [Gonapodya prolifera JEL478]|eukprot:KXS14124.1 NAD(P)-binding protein [Gonapodya prolifera JEL478]